MSNVSDTEIREILKYKVIAVVGCSDKKERASATVASYLMEAGYTVIPVNPCHKILLGQKCYPNLLEIPQPVEIVDIFRNPEYVLPIVKEAIQIGAKVIWMQDGVQHPLAEKSARDAGLKVISNDCLLRQHHRLFPNSNT